MAGNFAPGRRKVTAANPDIITWPLVLIHPSNRWFVDIDPETARDRLVQRHLLAGIEPTEELALARVEANDLPNGNLIRERSFKPDMRIPNSENLL